MEDHAKLIIVGAGIVGCGLAYHLTRLGWRDILVVDQGPLFETGGSTSHAPGLMFQTNFSKFMTQCAMNSVALYKDLVYDDTPCAYQVGGVEVATTDARMRELWRKHTAATSYGLESHIISPREVADLIPILDPSVIKGGYYVPTDMDVRGWYTAGALAEKAMETGGAVFKGHLPVTNLIVEDGRCVGVVTAKGALRAEQVLLATNVWASVLPAKVGLRFPILGVEHQYTITEPLDELAADQGLYIRHPILRHQDVSMYFRQHGAQYGVGSYNHKSMLFEGDSVGNKAERAFTPDDFGVAWEAAQTLLPALQGKKLVRQFNGFMAFANDLGPIMGESRLPGLLVCLGIWVTHAGGVTKTMAEWMTNGTTEFAMHEGWVNRFQAHDYTRKVMYLRVDRQYQEVYDIIHPLQQPENPRDLRLAPFHQRLVEQKGHFHTAAGWEAAYWYEENSRFLEKYEEQIPARHGWAAQNWSPIQGAEHLALRDGVALFNTATFGKFEVRGSGGLDFLNYVAANQVEKPAGRIIYTALCDAAGGIRADLTMTRLEKDRFWILTGGGSAPADWAWLQRHLPADGSVVMEDISSRHTGVALWGPLARKVLRDATDADVSNEGFPYFTARQIDIGVVPCLAFRLSYAGELGWEIYCPAEYGLRLWDTLWEAGRLHGIFALGAGAFNSLRLEKGYRALGTDLTTEFNPYEAGLGWAVRLNKGAFLGREALLRVKEAGPVRRLVCLTSSDSKAMALGKEPILLPDGGRAEADLSRRVGYVTSADFGYNVGKFVAYGYVPARLSEEGTPFEIQYFDRRFPVVVDRDPLFDPAMTRLKA